MTCVNQSIAFAAIKHKNKQNGEQNIAENSIVTNSKIDTAGSTFLDCSTDHS